MPAHHVPVDMVVTEATRIRRTISALSSHEWTMILQPLGEHVDWLSLGPIKIFMQPLEGTDYLHRNHTFHRDVWMYVMARCGFNDPCSAAWTEDAMRGWSLAPGCEGVKRRLRHERTVKQDFKLNTADVEDKMFLLDPICVPLPPRLWITNGFWNVPQSADPKKLRRSSLPTMANRVSHGRKR
ncbi:hypothetical protein CALVIDRAFT_393157 [Calocera viscosa TUFC12733]|uniref:Uncharacterized protein n=1 Tax=Calocera viscosa (strain TUFC12733) TaxID=1330018 RepID=A0A167GEK5_CALVF|nr:hypothetical protein CALVIDRAFT_393157 [Calocera viscosa TUFC12733]